MVSESQKLQIQFWELLDTNEKQTFENQYWDDSVIQEYGVWITAVFRFQLQLTLDMKIF